MIIYKSKIYSVVFFLNILLIGAGNGLFSRPLLVLFGSIVFFVIYKNINEFLRLVFKSYYFIILIFWCYFTSIWSFWPSKVIYESTWQLVLFLYIAGLVIGFKKYGTKDLLCLTASAWLILTYIFVALNDFSIGRFFQVSGNFYSKNNLGSITALMFIVFYFSCNYARYKIIGSVAFLLLLIMTLSKTSIAIMLFLFFFYYVFKFRGNKALFNKNLLIYVFYTAFVSFSLLLYFNINQIVDYFIATVNEEFLTGRGRLWLAMLDETRASHISGVGYSTVWGVDDYNVIKDTDLHTRMEEWTDKLVASDGGYVDILISIGVIGLISLFAILLDFFYIERAKIKGLKTDFNMSMCYMLGAFVVFNNISETQYLLGANYGWFIFIMSYLMLKSQSISIKR